MRPDLLEYVYLQLAIIFAGLSFGPFVIYVAAVAVIAVWIRFSFKVIDNCKEYKA